MNSEVFYTKFFHVFLISLLVIVCYSNTLQSPWHFDDYPNIVDNNFIKIKELSLQEVKKAVYFSLYEEGGAYTRPVASLTFAFNYLLSGNDTTSYHIVNICIHLITSWLVYFVFFQTINLHNARIKKISTDFKLDTSEGVALLGAVFWSAHPIHTQAVTYIVQRHALLAALFYMLAMYCYIRARLVKGALLPFILILFSIIFYLLGITSKQNAVLLPLALIGFEVAFFRFSFLKTLGKSRASQTLVLACVLLLALIIWMRAKWLIEYLLSGYGSRTFTLWERLITEPIILWRYIFLLLTPLSDFLSLESDIVASRSLFNPPQTFVAVVSITCLILFGIYMLKREPILGYAIYFFFVNHIVESTFIGLELYFEHRNYLPSVFIFLLISYFFNVIIHYYWKKNIFLQNCVLVLIATIITSEGNAAYLRNDIWRNNITLMEDSIDKAPNNLRAYISVSSLYMSIGEYDKALEYLKKAEALYNKNPGMHQINYAGLLYYNAAALYSSRSEKRDVDKAISLLYKSCKIYPYDYLPHFVLGVLLFEKKEYGQSEVAFVNASQLKKELPVDFYKMYGHVLFRNNKLNDAIDVFKLGLEIERSEDLLLNLVAAYVKNDELRLARNILLQFPRNSDSPGYLLNWALLSSETERERVLEKLATLLVESKLTYCEWIEKIKVNNVIGIIYPDIHIFEQELTLKYISALSRVRDNITNDIIKVGACGIDSDLFLTDDLSQ